MPGESFSNKLLNLPSLLCSDSKVFDVFCLKEFRDWFAHVNSCKAEHVFFTIIGCYFHNFLCEVFFIGDFDMLIKWSVQFGKVRVGLA